MSGRLMRGDVRLSWQERVPRVRIHGGVELFASVAWERGRNPGDKTEHDQAEMG